MANRESAPISELGDPRGATNEAVYGPYAVFTAIYDDVTGDVSAAHVRNFSAVRSCRVSVGTDGPPRRSYGPFEIAPGANVTQTLPANIQVTLRTTGPSTGEIEGGWNTSMSWA
jgi:hypothetical protein